MSLDNILLIPGVGGPWGRSQSPNRTEVTSTLLISPWKQTLTNSIPRKICTSHHGNGYEISLRNDGLNGIKEGVSYGAWYGPKDADRISGIAGKTIVNDYEYYNLSNSAWSLEYDLTHDFVGSQVGLIIQQGPTNGILELYRIRDSVEEFAGEVDLSGPAEAPEIRWVVGISLQFINGDVLKLKRKTGSTANCRVHGIAILTNSAPFGNQAVYIDSFGEQIINPTSSTEWAYNAAPTGETSSFFGNIAHQTPYTEKNQVYSYTMNGSAVVSQGIYTGKIRASRAADVDYDGTDRLFASFITEYKIVLSGIEFYHKVTFNEETNVRVSYVAMLPTPYSLTTEANAGNVFATVGNGVDSVLGSVVRQGQIASTTRGNMITAVVSQNAGSRVVSVNSGTGNKIYLYRNYLTDAIYETGEFIEETWQMILGVSR